MILSKDYFKGFNDGKREQGQIFKRFIEETFDSLTEIDGVGEVMATRIAEHILSKMEETSNREGQGKDVKKERASNN